MSSPSVRIDFGFPLWRQAWSSGQLAHSSAGVVCFIAWLEFGVTVSLSALSYACSGVLAWRSQWGLNPSANFLRVFFGKASSTLRVSPFWAWLESPPEIRSVLLLAKCHHPWTGMIPASAESCCCRNCSKSRRVIRYLSQSSSSRPCLVPKHKESRSLRA